MNNWAVILGASSGIGLECALRLAKNGINIYGLYLRRKKSEIETIKETYTEFGKPLPAVSRWLRLYQYHNDVRSHLNARNITSKEVVTKVFFPFQK